MAISFVVILAFAGMTIAGLVCLVIGLRGRPVFSTPTCAKCGYDLRALNFMSGDVGNCPECGAKLNTPRSVSFGSLRRWRAMVIAGLVMLVLPWLSLAVLIPTMRYTVRSTGPAAVASLSNQAILAKLPTTIDEPWDWQELERRLVAGTLSTTETESAIAALTTHLKAQRSIRRSMHLPWAGNFVKAAIGLNGLDEKTKQSFLQAYYLPPKLTARPIMRQKNLRVVLQYDSWELEGVQSCWALNKVVTGDGTSIAVKDEHHNGADHPDMHSGSQRYSHKRWRLPETLAPGDHELAFTFDMGVVAGGASFRGLDGRPGPAEKWPSPMAQWQETITCKITVVPEGQPVVKVVEDDSIDPVRDVGIAIQSAVVRPSQGGSQLALKWKYSSPLQIPLVYRVEGMAGGVKIDAGQFVLVRQDNGSMTSISDVRGIPRLPPEAKTLDLKLIPSADIAEGYDQVDRILGGEVEIRNIPLERYDVEE